MIETHTGDSARRYKLRAVGVWLRTNLFGTWSNTLLSLLSAAMLALIISKLTPWVLRGADWAVIPANLQLLLIGTYPRSLVWRIWLVVAVTGLLVGITTGGFGGGRRTAAIVAVATAAAMPLPMAMASRGWVALTGALFVLGYLMGRGFSARRYWLVLGWLVWPWFVLLMFRGLAPLLTPVSTSHWGGLTLTLILAVASIVLSFPMGLLLALGRRSSLPAISMVCTVYIEVVRGLPLIAILFMAQVMAPIFLPGLHVDRVLRAMIGFTLFTAAYMAENVRGGLQSVGKGQYEAAVSLGLNGTLTMLLVILPQALRAVIPSTVGQFISLFKDTALVAVVGLFDLLGIAESILANPQWLGRQAEIYLFAAVLYWMFSYSMSFASKKLEQRLGAGDR